MEPPAFGGSDGPAGEPALIGAGSGQASGAGRGVGYFACDLQVVGRPEGTAMAEGFLTGVGLEGSIPLRPHIVESMRTAAFPDIYFQDYTAQRLNIVPLLL